MKKSMFLTIGMLLIASFVLAQSTEIVHSRRQPVRERAQLEKQSDGCDDCGNHPQHKRQNERSRMQQMPPLEKLDLSDTQKEQIRGFHHQHRLAMIDLRAEVAKLELQKKDQLFKNDFRSAKRTSDQIFAKKGEIAKKNIDLREQIHQVLTNEQREQLKKHHQMDKMRQHGRKM